jgi:hypothetical protein
MSNIMTLRFYYLPWLHCCNAAFGMLIANDVSDDEPAGRQFRYFIVQNAGIEGCRRAVLGVG